MLALKVTDSITTNYGRITISKLFARVAYFPSLIWDKLVCQVLRGQNHWDEIEPGVILGAFPTSDDVDRLHSIGVRGVVNTCEERAGPVQQYRHLDIEQLRIPTIDFTEPTVDAIKEAIEFIDRYLLASSSVYVHCKSGRGRSATVVLCWLMHRHGYSPEQAQLQLSLRRGQALASLHRRKCVQEFWAGLRRQ